MSKTKKIAILAIIAMVLTMIPASLFAAATADDVRLAGAGREATSVEIANAGWTTAAKVIVVAADQANLVDALAAAPLAGQENAPILMTFKDKLSADVKAKIVALGAKNVYVVGAVSDAVKAEIAAMSGVTVEPIKGADRWATADAINAKLTSPAGTFVVGYNAVADALSVASFAAKNKYKIVLANADGSVAAGKATGTVYTVGGATLVKDIAGATRLAGADRYATNAVVAEKLGFTYDRVYVANGASLVDALAAAPLAAKYGAFIALSDGTNVAASSVIKAKLTATSKTIALGGTGVVSDAAKGNVAYVAPVVTTLAVESVSAINLHQIKVVFNKEVEEIPAETTANYQLGGTDLDKLVSGGAGNTLANREADKKTVIITLDTAINTTQGVTKAFKVKADVIQEKDTGKTAPKFEQDLTFVDVTAPTVASISVTGNKKITVTFSEAVKSNAWAAASYKLNGSSLASYGGTVAPKTGYYALSGGNTVYTNKVDITFDTALPAGTHTLAVGADTTNKINDTSNFSLAAVDKTFEVLSVAAALQITSVTGDVNGKVTVMFSEKVDETATGFTTAFKINGVTPATAVPAKDADDSKKVTMTFASGIVKEGSNVLEITKNTLTDIYGNKYSKDVDARVSFTATKDTTAPTVTNAYAISESTIRVFFSETIDASYATNSNFVLKDASGNTKFGGTGTAWNSLVVSSDKVDLSMAGYEALGKADYNLVIKGVSDASGNAMVETTKVISTIDNFKPTLNATNNLQVNTTNRTAKIVFNEPMSSSIGTLANYYYATTSPGAFSALPSGTSISVASDSKSATLTFPETTSTNDWVGKLNIRVIGATDAAGNVAAGNVLDTSVAVNAAAAGVNQPTIKLDTLKVYADSSKVWVEFETSQVLDVVAKGDFNYNPTSKTITATTTSAIASASATRTNKIVTVTWTDDAAMKAIKAAGKTVAFANDTFANSKNADGATLVLGTQTADTKDYIAPVLSTTGSSIYSTVTTSAITVYFNEALQVSPALFNDSFVIVVDGSTIDNSKVTATLEAVDNTKGYGLTLTWSSNNPTTGKKVIVKAKSVNAIVDASGIKYVPTSDDLTGYTIQSPIL